MKRKNFPSRKKARQVEALKREKLSLEGILTRHEASKAKRHGEAWASSITDRQAAFYRSQLADVENKLKVA